jgi:hypothetical protein
MSNETLIGNCAKRVLTNVFKMEKETENAVKLAMIKIQEAIDLLEKVKGENDEVDEVCDDLGCRYADLECEINS